MQEVRNGNEEFQIVFVKITVESGIYKGFPCFIMGQKNKLVEDKKSGRGR